MNLPTLIVLLLIALALAVAIRLWRKDRTASCHYCSDCPMKDNCGHQTESSRH